MTTYYYVQSMEENPNACVICWVLGYYKLNMTAFPAGRWWFLISSPCGYPCI
jgi:hypothetical protein